MTAADTGFDITSILAFQPPGYVCPSCRGLFKRVDTEWKSEPMVHSCPLCKVKYATRDAPEFLDDELAIHEYLRCGGWGIDHRELFSHATELAEIIEKSRGGARRRHPWPTTRTFFEVISRARYFVHFASWGMSHKMIGALKLASMRVPVYGWASAVESHVRVEFTEHPNEAPDFNAKVVSSDLLYDAPHQKLVIVDGLVAFKGSANLTNIGMRRADRGLDIHETVTDFAEVTDLNNKFFAPVWRRLSAPADEFLVYSRWPF